MEVFLPTEAHATFTCDILNEFVDLATNNENVVENDIVDIAPGRNIDQLTFPSQVTPPSWLEEAMMNMNNHNVSRTNE